MAGLFDVEVKPDPAKLIIALKVFNQESLEAVKFRLVEGANAIRNNMILGMQRTPKTGKKYKRGKRWHIASSPGNRPAIDTGQLLRSIVMDVRIDEVEVGVKSGAPYAKYLEEGTKKMKARPFLAPAIAEEIPGIERKILMDIERMKL